MSLSGKLLRPQNRALLKTSPLRQHGFTHPLTSLQCGATLQSLTNTKSFKQGQQLHAHIIVSGTLEDNTYLSTKIAAFYASCGRMTQAQVLFDGVVLKSSFLWNFMIRGYACNGLDAVESLRLFCRMVLEGGRPDEVTVVAVLGACDQITALQFAEISFEKVFDMNLKSVGSYICLSNIYAAEKRWDDVERVRAMVRRKGFKKPPGCSFTELDNAVHRFLVGDRTHEQTDDIYAKLDDLKQRLKEAGYKPDTN
ncbi:hypothetical protein Dsin_031595 [Dipteronia sinensis]|uniref:Pentatricopeptide repeat-containing protein n=1 Tax=Dipteronia sinensis TaxID=43782 RepID=A0AAE0DSH7_9ROSI|nr:hypothetical protein Dsin_031595 [Dipteronia sinensis]